MSTPVASARLRAEGSVLVLKAMMMPFDASASMTSESLTGPVAAWMTLTLTSLVPSPSSAPLTASALPRTSALRMMMSSLSLPALISLKSVSRLTWACSVCSSASRRRLRVIHDLPRDALIGDDAKLFAGLRDFGNAHEHRRRRWAGFLDSLSAVVEHRLDFAADLADDDGIALAQGAALDENRGDWAPVRVEFGFDDDAVGGPVGIGLELRDLGDEADRLQQVIDASALRRRDTLTVTTSPP